MKSNPCEKYSVKNFVFYCLGMLQLFNISNVFSQDSVPEFRRISKNKYALFSSAGLQLTKGVYAYGTCEKGYCKTTKDGKYGLLNYQGKEIASFIYRAVGHVSEGLINVLNNDGWGYIDTTGKLVIPHKYQSALHFIDGYANVSLYGKSGFINKKGELITELKYSMLTTFSYGVAVVYVEYQNGSEVVRKVGCINEKGEEFIPAIYDDVGRRRYSRMYDGVYLTKASKLIIVEKDGSKGACNLRGELIVPIKYSYIGYVDEETDLIRVSRYTEYGERDGYVNWQGEEVIKCRYNLDNSFNQSYVKGYKVLSDSEMSALSVFSNWRYGMLDTLGNIIIPFEFDDVSFANGYFRVDKNDKNGLGMLGYYNMKGENIMPLKYARGSNFSKDGFAFIKTRDSCYFINNKNEFISAPKGIDRAFSFFKEGLLAVEKNGKYGFINAYSEFVIPIIYDDVQC